MPFTLATWNINSVRLREALVSRLMTEETPDILCLQECKCPVDLIPLEGFRALGYTHVVARGQKGYNGVAILSKLPLKEVGAHDFVDLGGLQARILERVAARLDGALDQRVDEALELRPGHRPCGGPAGRLVCAGCHPLRDGHGPTSVRASRPAAADS